MENNLTSWMKQIESGRISRNQDFDLFCTSEVKQAKTSLARIKSIQKKIRSDAWLVSFEEVGATSVEVHLTSKLFSVCWKTHLSRPEWNYLQKKLKRIFT